VTNLCTEGMFGVYNRGQVVPSALEFKYLSSRSALKCATKSAMGLDDCQIPFTLDTKRKDDRTFIKDSLQVKQEGAETRDVCQMYVKCMGRA